MKWSCVMITLNGGEYLWYALKSVYDFIKDSGGQIIIIEGSTQYAKMVSEDGHSIDNTKDIIEGFKKDSDDGFIIYKRVGKVENKQILRNTYFEVIRNLPKEKQPDWILMLDDDELYKKEDLQRLDNFLSNNPNYEYVFNPQRWIWKDFKTEAYSSENTSLKQIKQGTRIDKLFYDAVGTRLRQGQYHERIFKWNPGIKHISHSVITDKEGRDIYIDPYYESKRIVFPGCPRYHYGYMTTTQRMGERFQYYEKRDKSKEVSSKNALWQDNYGSYLLRGKPANSCTMIREYFGDHPEIIKQHPYWEKGECPMATDSKKIIKDNSFSWSQVTRDENEKTVILYRHEKGLKRMNPKSTILDVGGLGRFAQRLVEEGHYPTVININKDDIRTKENAAIYRYGDITGDIPLNKDLRFDYICCYETLEHIKDKSKALQNIYKFLKEDGKFFGTVPIKKDNTNKDNYFIEEKLKQLLHYGKFKNIEIKPIASTLKENEKTVYWFWGEK